MNVVSFRLILTIKFVKLIRLLSDMLPLSSKKKQNVKHIEWQWNSEQERIVQSSCSSILEFRFYILLGQKLTQVIRGNTVRGRVSYLQFLV